MHYEHDLLEGPCDVYDNSGAKVASGFYRNGECDNGTCIENLETFIQESIGGQPITVWIVTKRGAEEVGEVVEKTINQRP
jgi:hypothetical protein